MLILALLHRTLGCQLAELHLTLGDAFSLSNVDGKETHVYTIGFTINGNCSPEPLIRLHYGSNPAKDLTAFDTKTINTVVPVTAYKTMSDGNVTYVRSARFFKIHRADLEGCSGYSLVRGADIIDGPIAFPKRPLTTDTNVNLFVVADLDISPDSMTMIREIERMDLNKVDLFMHVGDFAYEIENLNATVGDEFFNQMSKTAKKVPYIISPGNHESYAKGHLLNYRFKMPGTDLNETKANHFFDIVYKGIYFMIVNFDYLYNLHVDEYDKYKKEMYYWMVERINLLNKRADVKWRVIVTHRPFSCSDHKALDCNLNHYTLRVFEDLLVKHGFQFALEGHLHIYARHKPMSGFNTYPLSKVGAGAILPIVNGHCGVKHYFVPQAEFVTLFSPFVDKLDISGPTYLDLDFNDERFQGKLVRSDNGEIRDTFYIELKNINGGTFSQIWTFRVAVLFIVVSVAAALVGYLWTGPGREMIKKTRNDHGLILDGLHGSHQYGKPGDDTLAPAEYKL